MASLHLLNLHRGGRLSTWWRPCQRCRCSVDHGSGGTGSVVARAFHSRTSVGLGGDAAHVRLYHPSCSSQNKIRPNHGHGTGAVAPSPREEGGDETVPAGGAFADVPGATNTRGRTLAIVFTCTVCDTRSAKQFTEHAYRHGVVLVRCPGCKNLHLIADRLGWFDDTGVGADWDVEKAVTEAGGKVTAATVEDLLELTLNDVTGNNS